MQTSASPSKESSARDRILLTAHALFYRDGVRATGIDRVIAQAKVTKVTFYRHYPSKDDLVRAYLAYRHDQWMAWLRTTLARQVASQPTPLAALLATFEDWWSSPDYRGCAFINAATELGSASPDILETVRRHKVDMTSALESLLPSGPGRAGRARALALAIDGAIVHAQLGMSLEPLLQSLKMILQPLFAPDMV